MGRHSRPRRGIGRTQEKPQERQRPERAPAPQPEPRAQPEPVARELSSDRDVFAGPTHTRGGAGPDAFGDTGSGAGFDQVRGGHPPHERDRSRRRSSAPAPGKPSRGPRQEYLDAFDHRRSPVTGHADDTPAGGVSAADDVFAAGAPSRRIQRPADGTTTRVGSTGVEVPGSDEAPDVTHLTHSAKSSKEPGVSRDDFSKGRRGRTMTGIAAAAITTVLTVVVAGQVATGEDDSRGSVAGGSDRSGEDPASRSEGRKAPAEPKPDKPAPKTYHQKMSGLFEMDPKMDGTGEFTTISGGNEGAGAGTRLRYRVDVEKELGLDGELFARAVHTTLNDDRSWAHGGQREFERVSSGRVDFVITLASPGTTAVWCAKSGLDTTEDNVSCDSAATDRIMINGYRWARGSETFGDSRILAYRQMLINHEVGHRLGFNHVGCDKEGALAPVMMQQTKHLDSDGRVCRPNAWLHPDA